MPSPELPTISSTTTSVSSSSSTLSTAATAEEESSSSLLESSSDHLDENIETVNSKNELENNDSFLSEQQQVHSYIDSLVEEQISCAIFEASREGKLPPPSEEVQSTNARNRQGLLSILKFLLFPNSNSCINNKYERNMRRLLTALLLFWSILHTVRYALLSAKPLSIRDAEPPVPFFRNANGLVQDFYDGNIDGPEVLMARAELNIVMLYAPWDLRSKEFRSPFLEVASSFRRLTMVKFLAANCNNHRGHCRKMYKLLSFPVIFAHTQYGHPIVFNQPLSSDRLFNWILQLLDPLRPIHSMADYQALVSNSEFVAIGHFALQRPQPLPRAFHVFLNAAYKASKSGGSLAFGTIHNGTLAAQLHFSGPNSLQFHTFYEQRRPGEQAASSMEIGPQTKSQNIIDWVNQCMQWYNTEVIHQLQFEDLESVGKSEALFQQLNATSATVVLFTNILGGREQSPALIALSNLAIRFNGCSPAELETETEAKEQDEGTGESEAETPAAVDQPQQIQAMAPTKYMIHHFSQAQQMCGQKEQQQLQACCDRMVSDGHCGKAETKLLAESHSQMADPFESEGTTNCLPSAAANSDQHLFRRRCCSAADRHRRRQRKKEDMNFLALQPDWRQQMKCQFWRHIRKLHQHIYQELLASNHKINNNYNGNKSIGLLPVEAIDCPLLLKANRGNQSIGFLAIDKRFGGHLMRRWGMEANVDEKWKADSVAIVSRKEERIHWMDAATEPTFHNLAQFLANFLNGSLEWWQQNEQLERGRMVTGDFQRHLHGYPMSVLAKLNRQMFSQQILNGKNRSHDAVVFFSGGDWHGPSRALLHYLHQSKHYLHQFNELIQFYIFDTTKNSLPLTYDMQRLPTLAFFPAYGSSSSSTFPTNLALTMPNLLAFLLSRCQSRLRWRLAFAVCGPTCLERNVRRIGLVGHRIRQQICRIHGSIRRRQQPLTHKPRELLRRNHHQLAALHQMQTLVLFLLRQNADPKGTTEFDDDGTQNALKAADKAERLMSRMMKDKGEISDNPA